MILRPNGVKRSVEERKRGVKLQIKAVIIEKKLAFGDVSHQKFFTTSQINTKWDPEFYPYYRA